MTTWKKFPKDAPADSDHCWCRYIFTQNPPFKAQYNAGAEAFVTDDNGLEIPWWAIYEWKLV